MLRAVEGFDSFDGKGFDLINDLATAVVAPARIAFRVLVGEDAHHRLPDGQAGDVLARNELKIGFLALLFPLYQPRDFWVD